MPERPSDGAVSISYDPSSGAHLARFDGDAIAPSMAVVETMAHVRGTGPMELDPLVESIDPAAIDRLVEGDGSATRLVEFRYAGHVVVVHSRGVVEIRPPPED